MKKRYLPVLSAVFALLILSACSESTSQENVSEEEIDAGDENSPEIAVVLKASDAEYFKLAEAGAKQAFEDLKVNGKFMAASKETQEQELINILEDLSTDEPDALVVMPSTGSVTPTLSKYAEKDIPVLLIDTDLDWDDKLTYIGTDNYTAGQQAGEYLTSLISEGDEIAIIEGISGAKQNEDRVNGAKDYFEDNDIEVATIQAADFDRTTAVDVMENIVTAHPDIKGIYAANDEMALGASQAAQSNDIKIPIVGIDGTSDALESISNDQMTGTIQQLPYEMAYLGVENAIKAIEGEKIEERIDSGTNLITKDNSEEAINELNEILKK